MLPHKVCATLLCERLIFLSGRQAAGILTAVADVLFGTTGLFVLLNCTVRG